MLGEPSAEPGVTPDVPCTRSSLESHEELRGTAVGPTPEWLCLHVTARWPARLLKDPADPLPAPLQAALRALVAARPGLRVQYLRRIGTPGEAPPWTVLAASTRPGAAGLVSAALSFDAPDLTAALAALLDQAPGSGAGPLFLVCTHGRRDACCGRLGLPLARRLAELAPGRVWRTTHLGGHRFAPTLLSLPDGYCYGRLGLDDLPELLARTRAGQVGTLAKLRGRVAYDAPAQVAEIYLRRTLGLLDREALRLEPGRPQPGADSEVAFRSEDGTVHSLRVHARPAQTPRRPSCGAAPEAGWPRWEVSPV